MNLKAIFTAAAIAVLPAVASAVPVAPTVAVVGSQTDFGFGNLAGGSDYESTVDLDVASNKFFAIEALFGSAAGSLSLDVVNTGGDANSDVEANFTLSGITAGTYSLSLDGMLKATVPDGAAAQTFSFVIGTGATRTLKWDWSSVPTGQQGQMSTNLDTTPVPVPAGILLMGTALAGFGVMRRRKNRQA